MVRILKIIAGIFVIKLAAPLLLIFFVIVFFAYLNISESSKKVTFDKEMTIKMNEVYSLENFIIKVENRNESEISVTYSLPDSESGTFNSIESGETECGLGKAICVTNLGRIENNTVKIKVTMYE